MRTIGRHRLESEVEFGVVGNEHINQWPQRLPPVLTEGVLLPNSIVPRTSVSTGGVTPGVEGGRVSVVWVGSANEFRCEDDSAFSEIFYGPL